MSKARIGGVLLAVACVMACGKPKPGDSCTQPECYDSHTAFFCDTGSYQDVPCPGPGGCTSTTDGDQAIIQCDLTGTVAGNGCSAGFEGFTICENQPNALVCNGGTFTAVVCPTMCTNSAPDNTGGDCS